MESAGKRHYLSTLFPAARACASEPSNSFVFIDPCPAHIFSSSNRAPPLGWTLAKHDTW
jgi:hypothetical protein